MKFMGTCGIAALACLAGTAVGQCGGQEQAHHEGETVMVVNNWAGEKGSCGGEEVAATMTVVSGEQDWGKKQDIVDTAVGAGSFKTLVAAVQAAGLVETLKGEGPFTVFAPTDEAFAKLPQGTVETLLKPENRDKLKAILTYHVVPGKVTAEDVVTLKTAQTVNGQLVDIQTNSRGVKLDNANVVKTDIMTSNGLIHVIDRVIMPSEKNIVETAESAGSFGTLLAAAKAAGLAKTLTGEGPYTVFAPTDEAFQALGSTVNDLLKPENKHKLQEILKYHVVKGRVFARDAVKAGSAKTLEGGKVSIGIDNGRLTANNADIIMTDLDASNGVIHVIDGVLIPE